MTQSIRMSLFVTSGIAVAVLTLASGLFTVEAHEGPHAEGEAHTEATVEAEVNTGGSPLRERLENLRAVFDERQEARMETREELRGELETRRENWETQQDARRANMEESRETMKARFTERKAEIQGNITERLQGFVERVKERFTAAIERLENIAARIESRAEKLEAEGVDVEVTTEALAEARADLSNAQTLVADLSLETSTGTSTMRESFGALRTSISEIKTVLKEVHTHLREAVMNLKGTSSVNATATSSIDASAGVE